MYLVSRNSSMPAKPPSRPKPDCFIPPNGAAGSLSTRAALAAGFSALVVLTTAGGELELRTLRRRLGWSKANATEVTATLESRGFVAARGTRATGARS